MIKWPIFKFNKLWAPPIILAKLRPCIYVFKKFEKKFSPTIGSARVRIRVFTGPKQIKVGMKLHWWVAKKLKMRLDNTPPLPDSSFRPPTNWSVTCPKISEKSKKISNIYSLYWKYSWLKWVKKNTQIN